MAGSQSGKTSFTPLWLYKEIGLRGPGDYGFICPTFRLMEVKALPEFKNLFCGILQLGKHAGYKFTFSREGARRLFGYEPDVSTQVFFGHAQNPDSLESATYKAVVCDEAGQKAFKRDSWEAILRRLAIHTGRVLITTTPYSNQGWLRTEIYDRWLHGDKSIDFINFASSMNPAFPLAEFERARQMMPAWKFALFFEGKFERPPGLIYDCFDENKNKTARFDIPCHWPRYVGLDFGGVNTAAVFIAKDPVRGTLYAYREYKAGSRTAKEHAEILKAGEPSALTCVGGSKSEGQWRSEFIAAGLPVREPGVSEVEVGIDRVYGAFKRGELIVFDDLAGLLEELLTYSRELDDKGEPTEVIEAKETFHRLDALRYISTLICAARGPIEIGLPGVEQGNVAAGMPEGVFNSPTAGEPFGGAGGGQGAFGAARLAGKKW